MNFSPFISPEKETGASNQKLAVDLTFRMEETPKNQGYNLEEDDIDEFVNLQETRPILKQITQIST